MVQTSDTAQHATASHSFAYLILTGYHRYLNSFCDSNCLVAHGHGLEQWRMPSHSPRTSHCFAATVATASHSLPSSMASPSHYQQMVPSPPASTLHLATMESVAQLKLELPVSSL